MSHNKNRIIYAKGQLKMITPPDIYDSLFDDVLRPLMEYHHSGGESPLPSADNEQGEQVGRVIEFLERILNRGTK